MASAAGWNVFFLAAASSSAAGSNVRTSRLSTGTLRSVAGASSDGAADMAALAAFRDAQPQSARAPGGCLESWVGGGSARCDESWAGVECNNTTGRVVFLGRGDELEGCGLAAAPESLCMLSELEGLYATANRLRELPGCIANLTHLTDLDVSENELTVLPSTFDGLKLVYLYVSDNGLAALPSARVFSELEELDISGNQLVSLPDLRASTALRVLRVRGNRLRELPSWIGTLTHLTDLDVSKNELTVLPSTLGALTKLVYLSASDNGLTTMPSTSAFFELDLLDISGNQLVSLPELQASKALRVLRAGHNKIENISATLALPSATDVHLVNNRISKLPDDFGKMFPSVARLFLNDNRLETLPYMGGCTDLEWLYAQNNALTSAPGWIAALSKLAIFDASNNSIPTVTQLINEPGTSNSALTHLFLSRNPIHAPPERVSALISGEPHLIAFDMSFSTGNPYIGKNIAGFNQCDYLDSEGRDGHCAPHVEVPASCSILAECTVRVHFHDRQAVKAQIGGVTNLTLRSGTGASVHLLDERTGGYAATVPASLAWVNHSGLHRFHLFHNQHEIRSLVTMDEEYLCEEGAEHCPILIRYKDRTDCAAGSEPDSTGAVCGCKARFKRATGKDSGTGAECYRHCDKGRVVDDLKCVCPGSTYDTDVTGVVICARSQWVDPSSLPEGSHFKTTQEQRNDGNICAQCPSECATCERGVVTVKEEWRLNASSPAELAKVAQNGTGGRAQFVFHCPEGKMCPSFNLSARGVEENRTGCLGNHTGTLCDACKQHHSRQGFSDNVCHPCGSVLQYTEAVLGMRWQKFAGWASGTLVLCYLVYWTQKVLIRRVKSQVFANCRILIGSLQVLSLLEHTLDLVYPDSASFGLSAASLAVGNVMSFFRYSCHDWTWSLRWAQMVLVMPALALVVISFRALWGCFRRRNDEIGASNEVTRPEVQIWRDTFIAAMVLYPQISSAILSALRCRQLGEDYSVLMADYSVVCFGGMDETAASDYKKIRVAAVVLTLLVPVGVPAVLLLILWRQWRVSKGRWLAAELEMHDLMRGRMVNSGQLADHLRSSLADEHGAGGSLQVETLEEYHYARIQATFGVIVDDFKPQYWWFEPVDMLRKLALSGLLQFVEQGTATQVFCGTCVAFVSFGCQMSLQPYRNMESNLLKAAVDAQIFLAFLLSFILRVLLTGQSNNYEPLNREQFGRIFIGSMCCLLLAFVGLTGAQVFRQKLFRSGLVEAAGVGFSQGELDAAESAPAEGTSTTNQGSLRGQSQQHHGGMSALGREMSSALQRGTVSTRRRTAIEPQHRQPRVLMSTGEDSLHDGGA